MTRLRHYLAFRIVLRALLEERVKAGHEDLSPDARRLLVAEAREYVAERFAARSELAARRRAA